MIEVAPVRAGSRPWDRDESGPVLRRARARGEPPDAVIPSRKSPRP
jgi:hypothetical protein